MQTNAFEARGASIGSVKIYCAVVGDVSGTANGTKHAFNFPDRLQPYLFCRPTRLHVLRVTSPHCVYTIKHWIAVVGEAVIFDIH